MFSFLVEVLRFDLALHGPMHDPRPLAEWIFFSPRFHLVFTASGDPPRLTPRLTPRFRW